MNEAQAPLQDFREGDIFFTSYNDKFYIYKLLRKEGDDGFHVLSYVPVPELPGDFSRLQVNIYHLPMHRESFVSAQLLAHEEVTDDELIGYYEYMHQHENDFEEAATRATEYYHEAYLLTEQGKIEEAIEKYSKAVELVPSFFEAIDNRAFCKMDLGRWREAIADFRLSLEVNPGSLLAEFSIGECYFRLGEFPQALAQFERCVELDPRHELSLELVRKTTEIIAGQANDKE